MLKKAINALILISFMLIPALAMGQMLPEGKWWRDPRVAKQLDLTEDQIAAMDGMFVKHSRELIKLKGAVEQEQFELGVLIENPNLDEDAILKQAKKLEAQKAALSAQFWRLIIDVRKIIGYENFLKVKENAEKKAKQKVRRFMGQETRRMDQKQRKHSQY